jgi:DNA-binding transcriptional LysR family regulator
MEVRELRVFVTVCETGSISAAARAVHASQSSVSETVQSLERQCGQPLFVRSRSGVVATDAGRRLEVAARSILETHDRVLRELRDPPTTPGVVRLGVPLELPADVLASLQARLADAHPGLRLDLRPGSTSAQWEALRRDELDVALLRDRPRDDGFDSVLVVEEPMEVVMAGGSAAPVALEELEGLHWIGFDRDDTPLWWDQVTATLRAHGVVVDEARGLGGPLTPELKLSMARDGRSFALVPPSWDRSLPPGLVRRPLGGATPLVRRTWAVWAADSTRRDVAAVVAAFD